jgi:Family of unknown function (DUF6152)
MKNLDRRHVSLALLAAAVSKPVFAHHGWSSFDTGRPIYLAGKASSVKWVNPHAEIMLDVAPNLALPSDLKRRTLPAQSAPVDGALLLTNAVMPKRNDKRWEVEFGPLFRMELWKVPEVKVGQSLEVLGFTFKDEKGSATLRVEYLWIDGKSYGLRSSPV